MGSTDSAVNATHLPSLADVRSLLRTPWQRLDDAALLLHFRSRRGIAYTPVIDPEEVPPARIAGLMQGAFEFNGETHVLPDPIDWLHNPSTDVEWHILLHKFYYAAGLSQAWQASGDAAYVQRWAVLIDGWIAMVPPGFIAADVTGRRVQNWIASLHGLVFDGGSAAVEPGFFARLLASLHQQVEHLCAHLTPKRNHRTLELLAIGLAGVVFPEFTRAAHWRALALKETAANIAADLLPDGVHCELSTDYHHLALRNWLQLRQLAACNGHAVPAALDAGLQRALDFAVQVHQPHGGMPSFSDGDARGYTPLLAQAGEVFNRGDLRFIASNGRTGHPPAQRVAHFRDSGYHVVRSGWTADAQHLMFDCGPLGEGNHGHFDALSFELAAQGRPLLVDPGRYTYSETPDADGTNWRLHFRGTAAHNTVCVDGRNQTRYTPKVIKETSRHAQGAVRHKINGPAPDTRLLEAAHGDALDLLHGRCTSQAYGAVHERCIVFIDRRWWIVSDWLRGADEHHYALRFQLAPDAHGVTALASAGGNTVLHSPGLRLVQPQRAGHQARLQTAWVSARYGHKQAAPALVTEARSRNADFDTVVWPVVDDAPSPRLVDSVATGPDGQVLPLLLVTPSGSADGEVDGWFHHRGGPTGPWVLDTPAGALQFTGRWLQWWQSADGRVLRALSHAGAQLKAAQGPVALQTVGAG